MKQNKKPASISEHLSQLKEGQRFSPPIITLGLGMIIAGVLFSQTSLTGSTRSVILFVLIGGSLYLLAGLISTQILGLKIKAVRKQKYRFLENIVPYWKTTNKAETNNCPFQGKNEKGVCYCNEPATMATLRKVFDDEKTLGPQLAIPCPGWPSTGCLTYLKTKDPDLKKKMESETYVEGLYTVWNGEPEILLEK